MLFELGLSNFKPFGDEQRARLAPITLIYGPNSGGKSSVIQSLMLLKQTLDGAAGNTGLISRGSLVDLGSFKALVHRHEIRRAVGLMFRFDAFRGREKGVYPYSFVPRDVDRTVTLAYGSASSPGSKKRDVSELTEARYCLGIQGASPLLDVSMTPSKMDDDPQLEFFPLGAVPERSVFSWKDHASSKSLASYISEMERRFASSKPERSSHAVEAVEPLDPAELLAAIEDSSVVFDGGIPARLIQRRRMDRTQSALFRTRYRVIEGIAGEFSRLVASLSYLGPLRSYPERHYVLHGGTPSSVGKRGEYTPHLLFSRKKALVSEVNDWFEKFDIPYVLTLKELEDEVTGAIIVMSLKDSRTKVTVAPSDVGFGIGQLLPIIVEGLVAENRIICVEQPEIHLHPRLQANLTDFFIKTAAASSPDDRRRATANQWIIETHSEALILRIQKHIRGGKLKANNVSVLYVEPSSGGSEIRELRLDNDGEFIDAWPQGFFEERFDEMFGATP